MIKHSSVHHSIQAKKALEEKYVLSDVAIESLPGYEATNFKVQTSNDTFFLRRYSSGAEHIARYHVALHHHLANRGIPVAAIIRQVDGEDVLLISGEPHLLKTFINFPLLSTNGISPAKLQEAGRWLARIHECGVPENIDCPYNDTLWSIENFDRVLAIARDVWDRLPEPARQPIEDLQAKWASNMPEFSSFERSLLHNDFHQDNLMFDGDRCAGIIDFSEALPGPCVWDIASSLQYLAFNGSSPREVIDPFLHGYNEIRQLPRNEVALAPLLIRARAAISFILNLAEHGRVRQEALEVLRRGDIEQCLNGY